MKKILVVDDELEIIELLKEFLKERGYQVDSAQSASETYEKITSFQPDIILLDIRLPDASGIDVLKKVKELNSKIDVIMVTGVIDKKTALKAMEMGASDYVVKPIDLEYLETSILAKLIYK
ncbi:MAG: response regulator [Candidatus Marinimicrobia bacterium]|nr:response regulator [Candidatus Neomarinimicrobiota bacterium]